VIFINKINLQIAEISKRHIGKGIAIIDPKIVEENNFITGQIIELTGNKKSYVKLWSGSQEDYGSSIIKIDGLTRYNIGSGIGDTISIRKVSANNAVKITLSSTQKLTIDGLNEHMIDNYDGRVFAVGDTIMINTQFGNKLQLVVTDSIPSSPVIITSDTNFELGHMIKAPDLSTSRITYDDLGGLKKEIRKIREMIELPLRHPELFEKVGVAAPKGVLLYGPPGTGKTLLAKAIANLTQSNFISIKGPELLSKWVGESERGIREIFRKARQASPCVIFFDEIDSIIPKRNMTSSSNVTEKVVSQILTEIDGLEELHDVLIIGATNRLDIIDPALLRPGRFDRIIEVPNPNHKDRENIFKIHTKNKPIDKNVNLNKLAELTNKFNGAEIASVCDRSAILALKRYLNNPQGIINNIVITQNDFMHSIDAINSVKAKNLQSSQINLI
jgi:transitional endoplasmic reticulum ATPase